MNTVKILRLPLRRTSLSLGALLACMLTACSTTPDDPTANWSARQIYEEASLSLSNSKFEEAVGYFETLEARYPFGRYAMQAQLDIIYAYYKRQEYDLAIEAADRFAKLHPDNPHVAYTYYLKGLSEFSRGTGLFSKFFGRDLTNADQASLRRAFANFDTLIRRFPASNYASDAQQRMIFLRNEMARHELSTAEFYYDRGAMLAAINRIKYMVENYDGAPSIRPGLNLMARAYRNIGMNDLAEDALRILRQNRPKAVSTEASQSS